MEDALALTTFLRAIPDSEAAFATYVRLHKNQVEQMVRVARRTGTRKVLANALTCELRDTMRPFLLRMGMGVKQAQPAYPNCVD